MAVIKKKEEMNREEIIRWRFEKMLKMAEEINNFNSNLPKNVIFELAEREQYLRICGEKFMTVSLAESTPLSGYGNRKSSSLRTALDCFVKEELKQMKVKATEKEERCLQAWLIKTALQNRRRLNSAFVNQHSNFEEICFALDEVSLGDKNHRDEGGNGPSRCDLICIAKKNSQWVPLVVELKYARMDGKLIKQVNRYASELAKHRFELDRLLETITGEVVSQGEIERMVIMPAVTVGQECSSRAKKTYQSYQDDGVHLVEYKRACSMDGYKLIPVNRTQ